MQTKPHSWLTTGEAARALDLASAERVRQMIVDGVLDAARIGDRWLVDGEQAHRLAGFRASHRSDSAFARLVAAEYKNGAAAAARIDAHLARGPMFMSVRELFRRASRKVSV